MTEKSYKCSEGVIEMLNPTKMMWIVTVKDNSNNYILSESYPVGYETESLSYAACKKRYNYLKSLLMKHKIAEALE